MFYKISEKLWQMDDESGCTGYLLIGEKRAYMIDSGVGLRPLMPQLRGITDRPAELLLTHAHFDHYGAAREFDRIWLSRLERASLPVLEAAFSHHGACSIPHDRLRFFSECQLFDAGGLTIGVIPLPGHTPGSVVFVCPELQAVFTGDAIGSGTIVLMSIPCALTISDYRDALSRFVKAAAPYAHWRWYGGHSAQSGTPGTASWNPPSLALAQDMLALCQSLLDESLIGKAVDEPNAPDGRALRARLGRAGIVYLQNQLI